MRLAGFLFLALALAACGSDDPSYTDDMAEQHAGESPDGTDLLGLEEEPRGVTTEAVAYGSLGDTETTGYLARPQGWASGDPALVVIHEWWGLNENIEAMARRLAGQGYAVLAVDLYGGEAAEDPEAARGLMSAAMEAPADLERNLTQAYAYLREESGAGRVGVLGWCFGGAWALNAAIALPTELDAAVMYYGRPVTDAADLEFVEVPLLGLFGGADESIPVETVREFEQALETADVPATIRVFEGAGHAFANPSGERYAPEAAAEAWRLTADFLREHLQGPALGDAEPEV